MSKKINLKSLLIALASIIVLVGFDQWTKFLAVQKLKGQEAFVIIKNVFELSYLENRGMAFGLLQNMRWFFVIITLIVLVAGVIFYRSIPDERRNLPLKICLIFIVSGAIGNCIDRVINGYVVDFFYFSLINFPIFNVADIYVTVSFAFLIILLFFFYSEEELETIMPKIFKK